MIRFFKKNEIQKKKENPNYFETFIKRLTSGLGELHQKKFGTAINGEKVCIMAICLYNKTLEKYISFEETNKLWNDLFETLLEIKKPKNETMYKVAFLETVRQAFEIIGKIM